jgi:hypothetical protein
VSWGAEADGALDTGYYSEIPGGARQTFLVELDEGPLVHGFTSTPEPGFYGILAIGLTGLLFAVKRRHKA